MRERPEIFLWKNECCKEFILDSTIRPWYTLQSKKALQEAAPVNEQRIMQVMLLDFYGDLLTDNQRECCALCFYEDLSLSEIAEVRGSSRQAVWDNIRHAEAALRAYEEKTGLIARFEKTRAGLGDVRQMVSSLKGVDAEQVAAILHRIDELTEAL